MCGECPHCSPVQSAFETVTSTYEVKLGGGWKRVIAAAKCVACQRFILAAITDAGGLGWKYEFHYPIGKPNDTVSEDIPEHIRLDFQEALRCQHVQAYNATAEMCRRAIENSCLNLGVPDSTRTLNEMIDWLEEKRIITPALKKIAHKVRLGGDRAAHPPQGVPAAEQHKNEEGKPVKRIEESHADAIVGFTKHFLHHVYVIPKQLEKFDFSRTRPDKKQ